MRKLAADMIKHFLIFMLALVFLALPTPISAQEGILALDFEEPMKLVYPSAYFVREEIKETPDERIVRLESYLQSHNSPAAQYAEVFVKIADIYELDWRLVPAIAGVESTFCKRIPYNSYNCWGWANGTASFANYPEAIRIVSRTLKNKYIDRGLDTPEKMSPVYAPPSRTWAGKVRFFMQKIENYELTEKTPLQLEI